MERKIQKIKKKKIDREIYKNNSFSPEKLLQNLKQYNFFALQLLFFAKNAKILRYNFFIMIKITKILEIFVADQKLIYTT